MNWRVIFNPWGEIRRLRADNDWLRLRNDELWDDAREAEAKAHYKAREQFEARTKHLQQHNEHLTRQFMEIMNTQPPKYIIGGTIGMGPPA